MPAGPTASEAAEIILLLVDVPFLRSSLCVRFCCPSCCVVACTMCVRIGPSSRLRIWISEARADCDCCATATREEIESSFPRYRTLDLPAYHSALLDSLLRACAIATGRSQLPSELTSGVFDAGHEYAQVTTSQGTHYDQVECDTAVGLTQRGFRRNGKSFATYSNRPGPNYPPIQLARYDCSN